MQTVLLVEKGCHIQWGWALSSSLLPLVLLSIGMSFVAVPVAVAVPHLQPVYHNLTQQPPPTGLFGGGHKSNASIPLKTYFLRHTRLQMTWGVNP